MIFIFFVVHIASHAHDLSIKFNNKMTKADQEFLNVAIEEVSLLLPQKFKENLPLNIEFRVDKLNQQEKIPLNICESKTFVYGQYDKINNSLIIDQSLINEIKKGRENATKIMCQHKNIYDQVLATIIHELAHAYDKKNGSISESNDFISVSDYQHGLFSIRNKNKNPMRSEDIYETKNINEFFAVNLEYFVMDSEFYCRKPSLFNFYKNIFDVDPFPNRQCEINHIVMLNSPNGIIPTNLDPKRVYRIDYLLASPGKELSSGFGHSMFRLVVCAPDRIDPITNIAQKATPFGPKCLDDKLYHLVISYRANVSDVTLNYLKGIVGSYPSMLFILNFSDVLDEYNKDELRDVVSYPLNLSENQKNDFVTRVLEEHWNYRGSYKFFTNNCAEESFDLLNRVLDLNKRSPFTPKGVLSEFIKYGYINKTDSRIEKYPTKLDQLINSYKLAYNDFALIDLKYLQDFIDNSDVLFRESAFTQFKNKKSSSGNSNFEVSEMRDRLKRSSSFSVIEQQIFRTKSSDLKKKLTKAIINSKDERVRKIFDQKTAELKLQLGVNISSGYGIPLRNEAELFANQNDQNDNSSTKKEEIENLLKSLAPNEFNELNQISKNIKTINEFTLETRRAYKSRLDTYIYEVLFNLNRSAEMRQLLLLASQNDQEALAKIRLLIGNDLASSQEILNTRLVKIIESIVSNN